MKKLVLGIFLVLMWVGVAGAQGGAFYPPSGSTAPTTATLHVDDVWTSLGLSEGAQDLGVFSGTTIPDSQNVKQALQVLETAVEGKAAVNASTTGSAGSVKSNATTGVMQITGPGTGATRVMTVPDADFTPMFKSGEHTPGHIAGFNANAGELVDLGAPTGGTIKLASFAWDGGGSAVATANSKRCVLLQKAATVTGYTMMVDQDPGAGTTILNLDKDALGDGTALATTDMDGSSHANPPTVPDNKVAVSDTTITGWTTAISANDIICAAVATNAVATWISFTIYGTLTP